jgi:hypothetical protein
MKRLVIIFCLVATLNAEQILSSFDNLWMGQINYAMEVTNKEYEALNISYLNRAACRLPARHYTVEEKWVMFWSRQKCGYCAKPADRCQWLIEQKYEMKKKWTVTEKGKTEK